MLTERQAERRVYRSRSTLILMLVGSLCFILVGTSIFAANSAGIGNEAFGAFFVVYSIFLAGQALTERLKVTQRGLRFTHNFRRKEIPWSSIRGFDTGISRSLARWPCLIVITDHGRVSVGSIAGTKAFVAEVASELRRQHRESSELEHGTSLVDRVNGLGPVMLHRTDAELRALRTALSGRLGGGESADQAMAEAFAAVREALRRTTGRSYQDSELLASAELYSGRAVEAEDDGSNHFVCLLTAYFCAVVGESVHYITTSEVLAQRNFRELESACDMLGLRIGLLSGEGCPSDDQGSPAEADVTYGSYRQMINGYLGSHLQQASPGISMGKQRRAIIDQIDSILIDQPSFLWRSGRRDRRMPISITKSPQRPHSSPAERITRSTRRPGW